MCRNPVLRLVLRPGQFDGSFRLSSLNGAPYFLQVSCANVEIRLRFDDLTEKPAAAASYFTSHCGSVEALSTLTAPVDRRKLVFFAVVFLACLCTYVAFSTMFLGAQYFESLLPVAAVQ